MLRSRQLLALGARLQMAGSGGAAAAAAAVASSAAAPWRPAQHQLLSLQTWASSSLSPPAAGSSLQHAASSVAGRAASSEAAAAARRHAAAAAASRRGLATGAVARPGPAPRGTSKAGSGRSLWSGLFLLAPGALAAFLGKWQWDRRQWKAALLERRRAMMQGEPVDLFAAEEEPPEYVRVAAKGVMDHGASQYVGPRTRQIAGVSKQGFLVMTPLRQEGSGRAVLVNRGWVPAEWREAEAARRGGQPEGKVRVEGLLRHGEDPGAFVPPNEPGKGNWYYINVSELAAAAGLPAEAPLVEVVTEDPGTYIGRGPPSAMDVEERYPLPKSLDDLMHFSVMPQDHFNYAATWWTLSAATLALAVKAIRQGVRAR
ncbi:hypothetical protein CHLNCDRAFT_134584 [Chlorella variabilis]|uniref:SURF1-like protein n=1 Tax=Chlorella variabilis TaxID=554065 RepID=E1ZG90_CHLVA|nr:hypothetical protein CHLNCDRAFT_134584 [Chlorella variabilis]EFN55425.1 hypothetical protein CHLNCDRAFT_134584 [Chlorella variabilis]|eukprot:XP_005847527.1 hypothetical protein CHLNCDRAFT_134584 [Chlorella variabilis]